MLLTQDSKTSIQREDSIKSVQSLAKSAKSNKSGKSQASADGHAHAEM